MANDPISGLPAFEPVHPGEILREDVLPDLDMPRARLAEHLGVSRQTLYDIINEKRAVTADIAVRLGLGTSPLFWLSLQVQHEAWHTARQLEMAKIRALDRPCAAA
jgi:antitoxin HigA-1